MIFKDPLRILLFQFTALAILSLGSQTFAQPQPSTYRSDVDDLFTIEKVSVLPFTDNLQGIYARPLEADFLSQVDKMHRWDYVPANTSGALLTPEELEESPDKAQQLGTSLNVDAFFVARATKGPNGVTIHLSLFLSKDGKLLSQAILKDYKQFNLSELKVQLQRLLTEIVSRLPYAGRVLSREANRITVNLGLRDGLQSGQMLNVIQIIKSQRHPKFNFLVSTEKEILGKVKVLKVDETLSFGVVVSEREKGVVQKGVKIAILDFVSYGDTQSLSLEPSPEEALTQREDGQVIFGKEAKAWKPGATPSFGQVGGRLGFAQLTQNANVGGQGYSAAATFSPLVHLDGEIWITPEWTFFARLRQGIAQFKNPRSGSTPTDLNSSTQGYEAGVGYMFRFGPHVWSPFAEPFLGYFTHKIYTDTSTPEVFNTMDYSGFKFGVRGASPVGESGEYGVGGIFSMAFKPGLNESPYTSGGSSNNVVQFGLFGYKKLSERLKLQAALDFDMYSSTFSQAGSRQQPSSSTSHRSVGLTGGVYYMF